MKKNINTINTSVLMASGVILMSACGSPSNQNTSNTNAQEVESAQIEKIHVQEVKVAPKTIGTSIKKSVIVNRSKIKNSTSYLGKNSLSQIGSTAIIIRESLPSETVNTENYAKIKQNPLQQALKTPVSTFSIDVDTGAYSNVRRFLNQGQLPPKDAVRVEELINYFNYDYPVPDTRKQPFSVTTEIAPTPWNKKTKLLHIGLKGYQLPRDKIPPANLVFLVDVSGSMESANKLGLLKTALKLLSKQMSARDHIAIVVYAGAAGVVLEPTSANDFAKISHALDSLNAGGSTNGGEGIKLAYNLAQKAFIKNGINRIILATDGDFNVGTVNFEALINLIEEKRKSGIGITTLGFGRDNYNDQLMEQVADAGNGHYAYIDNLNEARKVLVDEVGSTLYTIAQDVKIQIEFNPDVVSEYRLIGYENRLLKREDFKNDKVDAGEIGTGHTVTALYEVAFKGDGGERLKPLRYTAKKTSRPKNNQEFAFLRLRYKLKHGEPSQLIETPLLKESIKQNLAQTSDNFRYSAAVSAFGQLLRGGQYTEKFTYQNIKQLAQGAK
ncbi:MAG: VWA domain-containing protein, partial [Methylococcales bacterium]|nr:VWA domain-containing protein [Methylococcales bacterium]